MPRKKVNTDPVKARIQSGEIIHQRMCDFIRELNSVSTERLNAVAISDGIREYTYRQMFRKWEEYAEAFTAANMTGENGSRVGVFSLSTIEITFAIYGLNMTGASVSMLSIDCVFDIRILEQFIRTEHLTDLVLLDCLMLPKLLKKIYRKKNSLGLRNIIMLHSDLDLPMIPERLIPLTKMSSSMTRHDPDVVYLEDLADPDRPLMINSSKSTSEDSALILHSSGTTSGVKKPIPYSDSAVNEGAARFLRDENFLRMFEGTAVSLMGSVLYTCYYMIDMLHLPLAFGGKVYAVPFTEFIHEKYIKTLETYKVNIAFTISSVFSEAALKNVRDLSNIRLVALGGFYVPQHKKEKIDEFLGKCGMKAGSTIGYGLSETGGACFLTEPGCNDDTIGTPLPGIRVKIFDEDEETWRDVTDGPGKGVLFISTPSMSSGRIDDTVFFEHTMIDGDPYVSTNDLVRVNENGRLTVIGRANKSFVGSDGTRFEAGLVERAVSAQPHIADCGIAAELDKYSHETIPVLYVRHESMGKTAAEDVRRALKQIFIRDAQIAGSNLPVKCVITDEIPYTDTGKVDVHRISNQGINGDRYIIEQIHENGRLTDIILTQMNADTVFAKRSGQNMSFTEQLFVYIKGEDDHQKKAEPPKFRKNADTLPEKLKHEAVRYALERFQSELTKIAMDKFDKIGKELPAMEYEVEEILNCPYMNRQEIPLAMDIFKPKTEEGKELPVIVVVHGGGLVIGDRKMNRRYARILAGHGYLVFTIEYRLAPRANLAEQLDDVCAGMDLIGRELVNFDVDFSRVFLTAESAGACLAIYVAAMKRSVALQKAIGYEPSRLTFKALGLISGMFYTQGKDPIGRLLSDQFYGEKKSDSDFICYMDPENPEIIDNLPPVFLITSRGDFLNNYTLRYHKALKKAGKETHLVYYGEEELMHTFVTLQLKKEQSLDAIDRMLAWFEEQADKARSNRAKKKRD